MADEKQQQATDREDSIVMQASGRKLLLLRSAARKHESFLMRQRKALDGIVPAAVDDIDRQLSTLREDIFGDLRIEEDDEARAKPDPMQISLDDAAPDYRTHASNNVGETQELVARIIDEAPSAGSAVIALNRLEDGEKERDGGARKNHLEAIANARAPLAKKATRLSAKEQGGGAAETHPAPKELKT